MIFEEQISREPNKYPWTEQFINSMQDGFWTHRKFNFQSDVHDFKTILNDQERDIIVRSLSSIGQLEVSVKKFWARLGDNLPHPHLNDLGYVMANVEVIHGNAYERLLKVLGIKGSFDSILEEDIMKGRVNYLRKHLHKFHSDNRKQFVYSLILFTLFVENLSLFSQFYVINWFHKYKNVLKDTSKQVEYTAREEQIHADVGIKLVNTIRKECPELFDNELIDKISYEAGQATKYECEMIRWILGDYEGDGLSCHILEQLIKNRMNKSLKEIKFKKIFEVDKTVLAQTKWFDEMLIGNNHSDFFHGKPTEYQEKSQSFDPNSLFA